MIQIFNKKKKIYILQKYFKEFCFNFYVYNILTFDLNLKILNLNIYDLNQIINTQQINLKLNITNKVNKIKEMNDSLIILKKLSNQKININLLKHKYFIFTCLKNRNYNFFLYFLVFYIYPIFKKRNLKNKNLLTFYILNEFNLFINPQYDFFENLLFFINFKFNIKNPNLIFLYLNSLKLI